jgi:hypothetical protein
MTREQVEIRVDPEIRVTIYGEEDWARPFSEVAQDTTHEPASISDEDMKEMVARFMDISLDELTERVYGQGNRAGKLVVDRPETGNITIRPETRLGYF